jgi:hypothetical protein
MEKKISGALQTMPDDELKGVYYPLQGMSKDTQKQLIDDHFLFKEGDRHLQVCETGRGLPPGPQLLVVEIFIQNSSVLTPAKKWN